MELRLQTPMHVVLSPTGEFFHNNIYELDYPHIIRTLSAHYPHVIRTLSTCCLSYEKRVLERILRCRHAPTGPRCTARVRLLDWDSHADGCHT